MVAAFLAGVFTVLTLQHAFPAAVADEKKTPDAFLSGGARSEKVLIEILTNVKEIREHTQSIDTQLANMPNAGKETGRK